MLDTPTTLDEMIAHAKANLAYYADRYDAAKASGDVERISRARRELASADGWLRICLEVTALEDDDGNE